MEEQSNPYYDPQKFNLTTIGEIEFADNYEFDTLVVWARPTTKMFLVGEEIG